MNIKWYSTFLCVPFKALKAKLQTYHLLSLTTEVAPSRVLIRDKNSDSTPTRYMSSASRRKSVLYHANSAIQL